MTRRGSGWLGLLCALWLFTGGPEGSLALAQEPAAKLASLPEPLTPEAIRELVARLSDAEVRRLLIAQLDKAAARAPAESTGPAPMAADMAGRMDTVRTRAGAVLASAPRIAGEVGAAVSRFSEGRSAYHILVVAAAIAAMLLAGGAAERLVRRLLAPIRRGLEAAPAGSLVAQAGAFLLRVMLDAVGLAAFAAAAVVVFLVLYQGHVPSRELAVSALMSALVVRGVALASGLLLAPRAPGIRLLAFDDPTAGRLHAGVVILAVLWAVQWVIMGFLARWGFPADEMLLLSTGFAIGFAAVFLRLVWENRAPIAAAIRGPAEELHPLRRWLADLWPALMTAYVVGLLVAMTVERLSGEQLRSGAGILSLLVVIVLPMVDMVLRRALTPAAARTGGAQTFAPVLGRGVHIVVTVAGVAFIARLWGIDLFALGERRLGTGISSGIVSIAVTLLLAYLAWQLVKTEIDRRIAGEGRAVAAEPGEEGAAQAATRLRTILPLLRVFLFVTITVMAALLALSSLGVNIGPLLAGAGVVGLAIGFGAQTLVRDVVSGVFFLMDDAFRLGEYIDVGDVKGTVERIGLRSMQLRHHRGALNTVPYGGIRRLVTIRDWAIEKLEFRVTYDTDITKVRKIIKRIGEEMMADPELAPGFLQPLKSQGIMAADDSALVVRAKYMARPTDLLYVIRREAYSRIIKAFTENGIKFAHKEVTVFTPPAGPGQDGPSMAARAAAAAVAAEPPAPPR
jgi:small-conductance mechanosensitive channel